jgi:hypothetical protein
MSRGYKTLPAVMLCLAILAAMALHVSVVSAYAEGSRSTGTVMVSPTVLRLDVKHASTSEEHMTVTNPGDSPVSVQVYAAPYSVQGEEYDPTFEKSGARNDIVRWITFEHSRYTLKPQESVDIKFTITVPESVPAGGQYAAIFAQSEQTGGEGINLAARAGMLLYAHTDGTTIDDTRYLSSAFPFWLHPGGTISTTARFINQGNTDATISGQLKARNLLTGETVFEGETFEKYVLPDTIRALHLDWDKNLPVVGIFELTQTLKVNDTVTEHSSTLVVLPWWLVIVCLSLVLILLLSVALFVHSWKLRSRLRQTADTRTTESDDAVGGRDARK